MDILGAVSLVIAEVGLVVILALVVLVGVELVDTAGLVAIVVGVVLVGVGSLAIRVLEYLATAVSLDTLEHQVIAATVENKEQEAPLATMEPMALVDTQEKVDTADIPELG